MGTYISLWGYGLVHLVKNTIICIRFGYIMTWSEARLIDLAKLGVSGNALLVHLNILLGYIFMAHCWLITFSG